MSVKQLTRVWEYSRSEGTGLLVMLALADHADEAGYCFPGVKSVARKCRISERSVQRALRELEDMGELRIDEGKGATVPGGRTSRYLITVSAHVDATTRSSAQGGVNLSPGDNRDLEVVTNRAQGGDARGTRTVREPSKEPTLSAEADGWDFAFDEFWDAYPRHTDKKKARDTFKKKHCFDKIEVILSSLAQWKQTDQWKRGFVPHPTTWLNGERWQDDLHHEQTKNAINRSADRQGAENRNRGGSANRDLTGQYAGLGRVS